jgi:hypothetical protein
MRQATPEHQTVVRRGKKVIVLFRIAATLDDDEVHPLAEDRSLVPVQFELANLDSGEPARTVDPSPLSRPAVKAGWATFTLEPGSYYLRTVVNTETWYRAGGWVMSPIEFRFVVPLDSSSVYIGSFRLTCEGRDIRAFSGWQRAVAYCSSQTMVEDESEAARIVADSILNWAGTLSTAIMQPYGAALAPGTLSSLSPVGILMPAGKTELGSPDWTGRSIQRGITVGLAPSILLGAVGMAGAGGGALGLAILWAPVGLTLGAASGFLGGKLSESSFEPCRQVIQQSILKFDPMQALNTKLKAVLRQSGVQIVEVGGAQNASGSGNDFKSTLSLQIQRIALRNCGDLSDSLCMEMTTRAQLFETATKTYPYDTVLRYSDAPFPSLPSRPFELHLTVNPREPPGEELKSYCKDNGTELLVRQLSYGLDAIVDRIVADLALSVD